MILIRCHTYNYHHGEALRCHHVKPASPVYGNSFGVDGVWRMLEEEEEEVVWVVRERRKSGGVVGEGGKCG